VRLTPPGAQLIRWCSVHPDTKRILSYTLEACVNLKKQNTEIIMNTPSSSRSGYALRSFTLQRGATLIELMVGITIGLLTIAVATGALMISRGISGTVTDASQLQQQASYAFRVFGQQLRQAGSMRLNLNAESTNPTDPILSDAAVAFVPDPLIHAIVPGASPTTPAVSGKDTPASGEYALSVAFTNYTEQSFTTALGASFFRDCLGAQPSATIIQSQFSLENGELRCAGSDNVPQSILRNVADFQVRYLVQTGGATGTPTIQIVNAATVGTNWASVFGVEVCLVLYGDEAIDMPAGSSYNNCTGTAVNMTTLPIDTATIKRKNRMHMTFRNVYQLRSQGLTG